MKHHIFHYICGIALFGTVWVGNVQAAMLSGTFTAGDGTTVYDLTAIGTLDWAYWSDGASTAFSGIANNSKGGGLIGNLTPENGTFLRGTTGDKTVTDVSYSDGTSPVSGSVSNIYGLFNDAVNTVGAGVAVSVNLPTAGTVYDITVWVSGQKIGSIVDAYNGLMTASLLSGGTGSYTDDNFNPSKKPKTDGYYNFLVSSDVDNDTFNISYALSDGSGTEDYFSHTIITAATISSVPEPATYVYMFMGAGLLCLGLKSKPCRKS